MATGLTNPTAASSLSVSGTSATWTGIPAGTNVPAYADARIGAGGKHVFQVTPSMGSASTVCIGFVSNSRLYNDGLTIYTGAFGLFLNPAGNQCRLYDGNYNNVVDIGPYTLGDSFTYTIDVPNKTYWCRRNTGHWNGSPTADPATNTGGISFAAYLGSDVYLLPVISFYSSAGGGNASVSCNFGATAISGLTVPSGFYGTDWSRQIYTTASQNAPAGWTDMNWIEAIGAGSNGGAGSGITSNGFGGGAGAFSAKWGVAGITAGAAFTYQLGVANGATTTTGATTVGAGPTLRAAGAGTNTASGGTTANSIGDLLFAGGNGDAGGSGAKGGSGGAAGRGKMASGAAWSPIGTGGNASGSTGGSGNNGTTAGSLQGSSGVSSTVEYGTAGSGSGSGGRPTASAGTPGGSYGAGGGGGRGNSGGTGGAGAPGLLVLFWYSPVPGPNYVYRGASTWAAKYKGVRTDAQIYKGTRILHP